MVGAPGVRDSMKPADFVRKWSDNALRERQGSHEHFLDLCRLVGEPTPAEDDPKGERYCFERGVEKVGGGDGWADVWRRHKFAWEYKGRHKNLDAALRQLQAYALDLENPPYLVVSDMERIIVHTNWTNTISKRIELSLADLLDPAKLDILRQVLQGSDRLKPGLSPQDLTAKVASRFGELGRRLQERGQPPRAVAHFLNRLVFCMFAEDARLLPDKLFSRTIKNTRRYPQDTQQQLTELFAKMASGGFYGPEQIRWFNGGLFDDDAALPLERADLDLVYQTAEEHDWSDIDPAIFGTLFEQALKATRERPALGAHYTDREKILKIVDPVIVRPLAAEWDAAYAEVRAAMEEAAAAKAEREALLAGFADELQRAAAATATANGKPAAALRKPLAAADKRRDAALSRARTRVEAFLDRLAGFRVLDPACGSGNFLYVALHALKDIELKAIVDAERLGVPEVPNPRVGLEALRGIEIEPYAAELARVTLWIGDLQWRQKNGFTFFPEPVLSSLETIECRDALLNPDGSEADWITQGSHVDVIVGNPPFLGDKKMRQGLGDEAVERIFARFSGRVPAGADFVCYWVEKAWRAIVAGQAERAGLVTTNSIRGGANRRVVEPIADADALFEAWADEPWAVEGAAVRVSMIGFGRGFVDRRLEGCPSNDINADLTGTSVDITKSSTLLENINVAFIGDQKGGSFDIPGTLARKWLLEPLNPNNRSNSDVIRPWVNGLDITRRPRDMWIIDFDERAAGEAVAALYEQPFGYIRNRSSSETRSQREKRTAERWWLHQRPRPALRKALVGLKKYAANPRNGTYKVYTWLNILVLPDSQVVVFARDDETFFGLIHSKVHEVWALRLGTWLGVGNDPRNTVTTTFDTFPFPEGLTPNIPAADYADDPRARAIAVAAAELNRLREAWLNPADLVVVVPEVVPTAAPGEAPVKYPDRILPRDEAAAKVLRKRTLTNLYNERPAWLSAAHARLDAAVAAAYGWPTDLSDEDILARLFALNQERAAAGR
jgi:type II restriction/modification system DNA methylase subunit YeeA